MTADRPPAFLSVADHRLRVCLHPGQWQAWCSARRIVCVLAGAQGGKTVFGPVWLLREMQRQGPGDYLVVTPTYPLLRLKALPSFLYLFQGLLDLGEYSAAHNAFTLSPGGAQALFGAAHDPQQVTRVLFGYASNPESLESATIQAAWLDEAGMARFPVASWEAILRRLSLARGRILITTTLYNLGWLKQQVYDRYLAGDPTIDVINFPSSLNPRFPAAEFAERALTMPAWRFNMLYRARYDRPAGLIYDNFDSRADVIPRFAIPSGWKRAVGLDFGGVNTAAVFFARDPAARRWILYRTYKAGGRTAAEHAREIKRGEPPFALVAGGSPAEDQWRKEFSTAGLPVRAPLVRDVEIGIQRVYRLHARHRIQVFDDLTDYLNEKQTYSRVVDDAGNVLEGIEGKAHYHLMDAERYIAGYLVRRPASGISAPGAAYPVDERADKRPDEADGRPLTLRELMEDATRTRY
ncbi:MAG: terminase [Chloroflexi bacterium]|nr:terminase [Chloroflexota bacterium]MBI3731857.1 terminase [Chloroflexota bacterium]